MRKIARQHHVVMVMPGEGVLPKFGSERIAARLTPVLAKLDEPMPLVYSTAGIVIECEAGVQEFKPGDRIAAASPHAGRKLRDKSVCANSRYGHHS